MNNKFTKRDLFFSILTGLITGVIVWRVLVFLGRPEIFGISLVWLVPLVPILWILGVNLGYFLGRWAGFFNQFGKYAAVGFTNFAIDVGVLNLMFALTNKSTGGWYTANRTIAVIVALLSSYIWNKYWSFNAGKSRGGGREFVKFVAVTIVSLVINTGVASLIAIYVGPWFNLNAEAWGSIASVVGSAAALIFSFIGYRFAVFQKSANTN